MARLAPCHAAPRRGVRSILPFEPAHMALLALRAEQQGEAERFGVRPGQLAEHGPAFTAAEVDDDGPSAGSGQARIVKVLACAGLAEHLPPSAPGGGYASAWASFAEGLGASEMRFVTAAIRGVLGRCGYARVDMVAVVGFAAAHRYAEALGFEMDSVIYVRRGGAAQQGAM